MKAHRPSQPDRLLNSYQLVRTTLAGMASGMVTPKTLHRLRIHLRRLQAFYELIGDATTARLLSKAVSRFSKLRTLHVFLQYLKQGGAPKSDCRRIRQLIKKRKARLDSKDVYRHTRRLVRQHAHPPMPAHARWIMDRLLSQRLAHLARLRGEALAAAADPHRRTLHALRLSIKSLRYQEECGFGHQGAHPQLVQTLKEAQGTLGVYEERAQFRKLARPLAAKTRKTLDRDYRRARKLARALPSALALQLQPFLSPQSTRSQEPRPQ